MRESEEINNLTFKSALQKSNDVKSKALSKLKYGIDDGV